MSSWILLEWRNTASGAEQQAALFVLPRAPGSQDRDGHYRQGQLATINIHCFLHFSIIYEG